MKPTIHHYRTQYSEERRSCTVNPQPKETDMSTQQTLNTLAQTSPEAWRTTAGPLTMRWAISRHPCMTAPARRIASNPGAVYAPV